MMLEASFSFVFGLIWQIIRSWWWLFAPFILEKPATYLWFYWRTEMFLNKQKFIILEIRIPKENIKPIRAMEDVFAGLWQSFYSPPRPWEKIWLGEGQIGFSLETISIGGNIHFYIRCTKAQKDVVESCIYSQYPEVEITLVEDYTQNIPQSIPNKDWEMMAFDYCFPRANPYPIKTYVDFEKETEKEEEKRVDPMAKLLEAMSKVRPGEQLWLQFQCSPIGQETAEPFLKEGEAIKDKLARRLVNGKIKMKPIVEEAADVLIFGKLPEELKKSEIKELIPPEMKLTPGEREVISAVERKLSKPAFECSIRFIFLGKKEVWFKPNTRLLFNYFGSYVTQNMNALYPMGKTLTKVISRPPISIFDKRRLYLRKRKMLRLYRERWRPLYPRKGSSKTGTFILNIEELASLYHFPSQIVAPAPGVLRVEAKKAGAPSELPTD